MKEAKPMLSFCARCHRKFVPLGEVLVWGKKYPEMRVRFISGKEETLPETVEIVKALCEECMVEYNKKKFDN
jgi:hypothetical protein